MKKYFILSCAAMFPMLVSAQTNINIYGKIDVGYGVSNDSLYERIYGNQNKAQQIGNAYFTSHWGLKGSEELGNGYQVIFRLEHSFNPEDGSSNGDGFDRFAYVGIKAPWGTLRAGRQMPLTAPVLGPYDVSYAPNMSSSAGNAGLSAYAQKYGNTYYSRVSSSLQYETPEFHGTRIYVGYEGKNDEGGLNNLKYRSVYSAAVSYRYKKFQVAAGYESSPQQGVNASWGIGALYDFGLLTLSASFFDNHIKDDGKGFTLGIRAPIQAWTLGTQIAYNTDAGNKLKPLAWELFCYYNLSKRSMLYLQYGGINNDAKEYVSALRKSSLSLGLVHDF